MLFCRFVPFALLLPIFLKRNYSLRQNILKNTRVWERSLTSVPIGVYLDLILVGTRLGTSSTKELWRFAGTGALDAASDAAVQRPVSSQEVNCCWRSDRTLSLCIWSGRDPASGRLKENQAELTGPCLRPVMDHQTRPVVILEELDLFGIDRTLGGSVRSLPPERLVSRKRAGVKPSSLFPILLHGGPL